MPPNIHVFLWFIVRNKSLTRDNLAKRQIVPGMSCVFCLELESIQHLFFDCIVAKHMWEIVAEILHIFVPCDFESIAFFWNCGKKCEAVNLV